MPAVSASAPAKTILLGEHAVVYGRPAIAVPLPDYQARVYVQARPRGMPGEVLIDAADVGIDTPAAQLPQDHPFRALLDEFSTRLGRPLPACSLRIRSSIPVAAGMGSSAAVAVATARALAGFTGLKLEDEEINHLAYAVEQRQHGSPSGIDNTVITYNRPIYFQRGRTFELLKVKTSLTLLIGGSGVPASTAQSVAGVRQRWELDTPAYERLFDQVALLVDEGRSALAQGDPAALGRLMDRNQVLLEQIGVSSPALEHLIGAARGAGALGAKLTGGGMGGNMIALVSADHTAPVRAALEAAGAAAVLSATIPATG